ncbi:uncharacterized protein [Antedon mediterranea]|uniref:uncharacterized protein n=1 Tax=Antedon mediterranea TaxID=105859 RepID=UPI003AF8C82F
MDNPPLTTPQKFIKDNYFQVPSDVGLLQNGHVIFTYITLPKKMFSSVQHILKKSHSIIISNCSVRDLVKKFKSFHSINTSGRFANFDIFCAGTFSKYKTVDAASTMQASSSNIPSLEAATQSSSENVEPLRPEEVELIRPDEIKLIGPEEVEPIRPDEIKPIGPEEVEPIRPKLLNPPKRSWGGSEACVLPCIVSQTNDVQ